MNYFFNEPPWLYMDKFKVFKANQVAPIEIKEH